jgi:RNA polymerase sigma-70 factor (ECF subfamily)
LSQEQPEPIDPTKVDFSVVVHEHWNAVFRLVYSLGGNVHETEDLTQETFVRALDRLAAFRIGTNMRAWLLRIATNAFFDEKRKTKRSKRQEMVEDVPSPRQSPEHDLETAEQAALAVAAMAELTELTRLVFHLRVQEDLSFREIAELAGTTEQAARWHMHQARTKLLAKLGEKPTTEEKP